MFLTTSHFQKLIVVCTIAIGGGMSSVGCQRRAYTDLYVEKMAGEIRELEDRIYEYDAAYRQSEDELDVIRAENEALHQKLSQKQSNQKSSPLRQRLEELQDSRKDASSSSKLEFGKPDNKKPKGDKSPSSSGVTTPSDDTALPIMPRPEPLPDPLPNLPPSASSTSPSPSSSKSLLERDPAPAFPKPQPSIPKKPSDSDLMPPEIDLGVPSEIESTPFRIPSGGNAPNANPSGALLPPPLTSNPSIPLPDDLDAQSVSAKQIVLPSSVQLASAVSRVEDRNLKARSSQTSQRGSMASPVSAEAKAKAEVIGRPDWIPQPVDRQIVEIAFHPSLCRGSNRPSDPNEDGMRIVLQPRNKAGEFLAEAASMTIVITDPERPTDQSKLGRWTWTAEELKSALEPIGVSQGFHVAIAWQAQRPQGKKVEVHVRYEMLDGRRLVNQKTVELYAPSLGSDAWTPRVPK